MNLPLSGRREWRRERAPHKLRGIVVSVCVKVLSRDIPPRVFASINHGPQAGPISDVTSHVRDTPSFRYLTASKDLHARNEKKKKREGKKKTGPFEILAAGCAGCSGSLPSVLPTSGWSRGLSAGVTGDTGNVLRIIYPFHPAHPLRRPSTPLPDIITA